MRICAVRVADRLCGHHAARDDEAMDGEGGDAKLWMLVAHAVNVDEQEQETGRFQGRILYNALQIVVDGYGGWGAGMETSDLLGLQRETIIEA